ncbi:MAG: hypothetical protein ACRD8W_08715 [Nitrososphaeraceae archaeon]
MCIWSHSFSLEINRNSKEFKNNVLTFPQPTGPGGTQPECPSSEAEQPRAGPVVEEEQQESAPEEEQQQSEEGDGSSSSEDDSDNNDN